MDDRKMNLIMKGDEVESEGTSKEETTQKVYNKETSPKIYEQITNDDNLLKEPYK